MSKRRPPARELPELVTLLLSLAVVLVLIGGVVYVQVARGDQPPVIAAEALVDEVRVERDRFYLPLEISNSGDQAAEAIVVVVVQRVDDQDVEHEFLIDYLAGHGTADATAVLTEDPRRAEVKVEVRGFQRR